MVYKILIVDDHLVVREGLKLILETNPSFRVIGEADNGNKVFPLLDTLDPDVILMDLNMPVLSGIDTMKMLRAKEITIPIIVLTTYNEDELMLEAMELGAKGYLLKDTGSENLFRTIESAARGETLVHPELMRRILSLQKKKKDSQEARQKLNLTEKELFILIAISKGYRNKEIAFDMGIAERTVKAHLTNTYNKLGVDSRSEAVAVAFKKGFI